MAQSPQNVAAQELLKLHEASADARPPPEHPPPEAVPEAESLQDATLAELHKHTGAGGGRILLSFDSEVFDVTSARDMFGPDGKYAALAGADATRCLSEMTLDPDRVNDLRWKPDNSEEEKQLREWKQLLRARYPSVGNLKSKNLSQRHSSSAATPTDPSVEGLRNRAAAILGEAAMARAPDAAAAAGGAKCPISGKEGMACPMSMFGIDVKKQSSAPAPGSTAGAASGFMAGKSLIQTVERQKSLGGNNDSILYKLCPLHADEATLKVVCLVAAVSWISGVFIGWKIHQEIRGVS